METCFGTLLTIYSIVRFETSPETYLCSPHEIILRQSHDWQTIQTHLDQLEKDKYVTVKHLDKIAVCITAAGIQKSKALKNNFVVDSFSFSSKEQALQSKEIE